MFKKSTVKEEIFKQYRINSYDDITNLTKKELLEIATSLKIIGRHAMIKEQLAKAVTDEIKLWEDINAGRNEVKEKQETMEEKTANNKTVTEAAEKPCNEPEKIVKGKDTTTEKKPVKAVYAVRVDEGEKRPQSDYINSIEKDMIIAFMVAEQRAISAKVESVKRRVDNAVTSCRAQTRNGMIYDVPVASIIWVKTGDRWPRNVFNLLKGRPADYIYNGENNIPDKHFEVSDNTLNS